MKNLICLLTFCLFMAGCKKESLDCCCYSLDTGTDLTFLNEQGQDLLDENTEGYFPVEDIKVYYLVDGVKQEALRVNGGTEDGLLFIDVDEFTPIHRLRVFTSSDEGNIMSNSGGVKRGESITYLQLNDQVTDTIRAGWEAGECYFRMTKIWYNGVLYDPIPPVIEIVK